MCNDIIFILLAFKEIVHRLTGEIFTVFKPISTVPYIIKSTEQTNI